MSNTSQSFTFKSNAPVSNMVKAMQGWSESLGKVDAPAPSGKFGRVVIIESGNVCIDGSQLDVEFTVPFDDDLIPNEAEITVYNLTKATIAELKQNARLTITAGYTGETGVIFSGLISKVTTKWSGNDKVTTIYAVDSHKIKDQALESVAFTAGTSAKYILSSLVSRLNIPRAAFSVNRDHSYSDGVTVDGGLLEAIKQYAAVCGVSAYINKGKVYVRPLSEGDDTGLSINTDTGLLDSPEEFTEEQTNEDYVDTVHGVKMKMLLEHRLTTAAIVTLKSRDYNGQYRVREGQHVCTDSEFYTEITCVDKVTYTKKPADKAGK